MRNVQVAGQDVAVAHAVLRRRVILVVVWVEMLQTKLLRERVEVPNVEEGQIMEESAL